MDLDTEPDTPAGLVGRWRQINLTFTDWQTAENFARSSLAATLTDAEDNGILAAFWFVRKSATWRLRLLPNGLVPEFYTLLAAITGDGRVLNVTEPFYRPEQYAFGGAQATDLAHTLFHADSRHILIDLAATNGAHRRELAIRLATRLMQAAGLEFYEQGDVWHHLGTHRHQPATPEPSTRLIAAVQRLLTASTDAPMSSLSLTPAWPAAHEHAGRDLAALDRAGTLTRDLRGLLTHHILFLFNRLGVSAADTAQLAEAAVHVTFHQPSLHRTGYQPTDHADSRVETVETSQNVAASADAAALRAQLVALLEQRGHIRTPRVRNAFNAIRREQFLPDVNLETVYTRRQIVTKRDPSGAALSSASSPSLVADMLEQLEVQPGDHVLEIGAATGINAALLAELTGPDGRVTTIELDQDLADGARAGLTRAGYPTVEVICGDGALGHPQSAPYDRIIITAGAWDIPMTWWDQLAEYGRIVIPLRLHESGLTRCFAFDRLDKHHLISATNPLVCGFVPMRGTTEHADHHVRLHTDVALKLDAADQPDRQALSTALNHPQHHLQTGILLGDSDPVGHLDLWLLVNSTRPFGRLRAGDTAQASRLVTPAYRWAGAAIYHGGTLAYPTLDTITEGSYHLGITAHGPDADQLAAELNCLLAQWNTAGRPNQPTVIARPTTTHTAEPHDISRPHTTFTIDF